MNEKTKLKQLTLRLPEELHRKFKLYSVKEGRPMGEVAMKLIEEHLNKESN